MKKLFTLLSLGSIVLTAQAQESRNSVIFGSGFKNAPVTEKLATAKKAVMADRASERRTANKTTALTQRWYNYANYVDTFYAAGVTGNTTGLSVVPIWNDTAGQLVFTSGLAHNTFVSAGSTFHPQAHGFNDAAYYAGEMELTTQAYQIDSLVMYGLYIFNPAKTSVVDTMTITLVQGSTATTGDDIFVGSWDWASASSLLGSYGLGSSDRLTFAGMFYDSTLNTADGATKYTFKFTLGSGNWGDTFANGIFSHVIKLPAAYNVNANNIVGISMSFKSGDPTFVFGDTLNDEYNQFRPLYSSVEDAGGTTVYPFYDSTDRNAGQFKTLPNFENGWLDNYVPMYAWSSGGNASTLQFSNMDIHVVCATCDKIVNVNNVVKNITGINAYPNPSNTEVNIAVTMKNAADAKVTLTNAMGQVIGTQSVINGKATFNTSALAAGVYMYSVVANGEQATGRFTVAH